MLDRREPDLSGSTAVAGARKPQRVNQPTLLVLAAGMGSRYGGLKQLDPMGPHGETVLDFSVFDAIRAGFRRVVFVIREDFAEAFRQQVGERFAGRIDVEYVFQRLDDLPPGFEVPEDRVKPWGTAHAVRAARDAIDGPFAVINADDFYGEDAYRVLGTWFGRNTDGDSCAMVGYPLRNTLSDHGSVNRGICRTTPDGRLAAVEEILGIARAPDGTIRGERVSGETLALDPRAPASMNFWGFPQGFFGSLEEKFIEFLERHGDERKAECYIPAVIDELIREDRCECRVLATEASWFGMTYPDDKPRVVEAIASLVRAGSYPSPLS